MSRFRDNSFTIYDVMEKKGAFSSNPANTSSYDPVTNAGLYRGPVPFPKMLYHPKGESRVTVPAEVVMGPYGPTRNSEQRELISKIVNDEAELAAALAEGWHQHPADAIAAGLTDEQKAAGVTAPVKGAAQELQARNAEVDGLRAELEELKRQMAEGTKPAAQALKTPENQTLAPAKLGL